MVINVTMNLHKNLKHFWMWWNKIFVAFSDCLLCKIWVYCGNSITSMLKISSRNFWFIIQIQVPHYHFWLMMKTTVDHSNVKTRTFLLSLIIQSLFFLEFHSQNDGVKELKIVSLIEEGSNYAKKLP